MLLDSNLIIYASKPGYDDLRGWMSQHPICVSALRQQRKMSLGDATIAATALVNKMPIATHNVTDFQWIPNLVVIDPIKRI